MLVHNKGNYIRHIGVRLIPGTNSLNEVEAQTFKKALDHPLNKTLVQSGEIAFENDDLSGFNTNKAIELVKDTYDLSLLEDWKESETRKTVLKGIEEQIESIKNPPEDKVIDPNE